MDTRLMCVGRVFRVGVLFHNENRADLIGHSILIGFGESRFLQVLFDNRLGWFHDLPELRSGLLAAPLEVGRIGVG